MSNVHFRGISAAVRRAINSGGLVGEIRPDLVRDLLPNNKKAAPDSVIISSLKHLANLNEIREKNGEFFTKNQSLPSGLARVIVIGILIKTVVSDGKCVATIEVEQMEESKE